MWLEHATPENPVCPKGYGCAAEAEPTIEQLFDKVLKRLDEIEAKVTGLQNQPVVAPIIPTTSPFPPTTFSETKCSKCGMVWKGVMGYVCSQTDCPVQVKVARQSDWQSYNISSSVGGFDVENLDPVQRSWYIDGDGTKRRKE
jgi:hypothetical protein